MATSQPGPVKRGQYVPPKPLPDYDADISAINSALATKANAASLSAKADSSALAGKADKATVDTLATAVSGKADNSTVSALSTTVASKASQSSVDTLSTAVAGKASAAAVQAISDAMPIVSTTTPKSEATTPTAGASVKSVSKDDHQHPRLSSATIATLAANGTATITFTRTFPTKPAVIITEIDSAASQPLVCVVQSFVMTSGAYSGAIIKGYRAQPLPQLTTVSGILTAVITGVNALVSSLANFNVFAGTVAGASVSVIALMQSS